MASNYCRNRLVKQTLQTIYLSVWNSLIGGTVLMNENKISKNSLCLKQTKDKSHDFSMKHHP